MIYILVILLGVLIYRHIKLRRKLNSVLETSSRLIHQSVMREANLREDVRALEIGKDELQETYEQQFLSHLEKMSSQTLWIQMQKEQIEDLANVVRIHEERCLLGQENLWPQVAENTHAK